MAKLLLLTTSPVPTRPLLGRMAFWSCNPLRNPALLQQHGSSSSAATATATAAASAGHRLPLHLRRPASVTSRPFTVRASSGSEVYVDPGQESYSALEFVKSLGSTLGQKARTESKKASDEGYKIDWSLVFKYGESMQRGIWQQGGILVVGPGKETVKYVFKDEYAGHEPQIEEIISACCA